MRVVDTKEWIDSLIPVLKKGSQVSLRIRGNSMNPFLHDGDMVCLQRKDRAVPGDVILFSRQDGRYILHRIVKVHHDSVKGESYTVIGDNSLSAETVCPDQIQAVLCSVQKDGKWKDENSLYWKACAVYGKHLWMRKAVSKANRLVHWSEKH